MSEVLAAHPLEHIETLAQLSYDLSERNSKDEHTKSEQFEGLRNVEFNEKHRCQGDYYEQGDVKMTADFEYYARDTEAAEFMLTPEQQGYFKNVLGKEKFHFKLYSREQEEPQNGEEYGKVGDISNRKVYFLMHGHSGEEGIFSDIRGVDHMSKVEKIMALDPTAIIVCADFLGFGESKHANIPNVVDTHVSIDNYLKEFDFLATNILQIEPETSKVSTDLSHDKQHWYSIKHMVTANRNIIMQTHSTAAAVLWEAAMHFNCEGVALAPAFYVQEREYLDYFKYKKPKDKEEVSVEKEPDVPPALAHRLASVKKALEDQQTLPTRPPWKQAKPEHTDSGYPMLYANEDEPPEEAKYKDEEKIAQLQARVAAYEDAIHIYKELTTDAEAFNALYDSQRRYVDREYSRLALLVSVGVTTDKVFPGLQAPVTDRIVKAIVAKIGPEMVGPQVTSGDDNQELQDRLVALHKIQHIGDKKETVVKLWQSLNEGVSINGVTQTNLIRLANNVLTYTGEDDQLVPKEVVFGSLRALMAKAFMLYEEDSERAANLKKPDSFFDKDVYAILAMYDAYKKAQDPKYIVPGGHYAPVFGSEHDTMDRATVYASSTRPFTSD